MDQADSLRELMRQAQPPRPTAAAFGRRVLALQSVAPLIGKGPLVLMLAYGLSRAGFRILILDEDGAVSGWGASPLRDNWRATGFSPGECLQRISDGIYVLPMMGLRSRVVAESIENRELLEAVFESYTWNPDLILISQGSRVATDFPRCLVTDGSREHLDLLRDEFMTGQIRQAAVAYVGTLEARSARLAFEALERCASAFGSCELFYSGFLDLRERSLLHLNSETLSDWESGLVLHERDVPAPVTALSSWIAKRILEWLGEVPESDRRAPIVHRFTDEPEGVESAAEVGTPGKWEGFWKALFGEVNA